MKTNTKVITKIAPEADAPLVDWARYYATEKGWPILPVKTDKTPFTEHGVHDATTNPTEIEEWWSKWPNANIGFAVGEVDMMALDLDPGHDMKVLEGNVGPIPETPLQARTPRGGFHKYLRLKRHEKVAMSASKLAPHVDVRSFNSYTLLPPSRTKDGEYTWESQGKPSFRTDQMVKACNAPKERHEDYDTWIIEADLPENIDLAIKWLTEEADIAVEGQGGDHMAYKTGAAMKSFGLSMATAQELMWDHWNLRCSPPWKPSDIDHFNQKVVNAYAYNNSPPGNLTQAYRDAEVSALFEPVVRLVCNKGENLEREALNQPREKELAELAKAHEPPTLFKVMQAALGNDVASFPAIPLYNLDELADLPDPEWDMELLIGRGKMGMIVGKWGDYKTFISLSIAVSLAGQLPWPAVADGGCKQYKVPKALRVLYIAAEGGAADYNKRIGAEKENRKEVDLESVNGNFVLATASAPLDKIAGQRAIADAIERATKMMGGAPEVIFCDTLAKSMAGEENSNTEMGKVQRAAAAIQRYLDCTFIFVHHTGKGEDKSGRGASSMPAGLDFLIHVKGEGEIMVATVNVEKQKDAPAEKNIILQGRVIGNSLAFSRVAEKPSNSKDELTHWYRQRLGEIIEEQQGQPLSTTQLVVKLAPEAIPDFDTLGIEPQRKVTERLRSQLRRGLFDPKLATSVEAQDFRELYREGQGQKAKWKHKDAMVE